MAMQEFTASQLGLEQNLTQELRVYTEKWFQRMSQERQANELQAIVHKAFEELLIHTFTPDTVGNSLPRRIHDFILCNLRHGITLKDLSAFLGYSEKYCSEFFRNQMGEPFSVYLKRVRIEKAKHLLEDETLSLTQIADVLGFQDQFAFSHFFKKGTGFSPRQFRSKLLEALQQNASHSSVFSDIESVPHILA